MIKQDSASVEDETSYVLADQMARSWLAKIYVQLIADLIAEMFEYFLKISSLRLDYLLNDLVRIKCKEIKNQVLIKSFWEKERIPKNENGSMQSKKYGKCRSDNLQQKIRNAKNFEITDATERQRPDQMLNEGYILGKLTNRLGNVV